MEGNAGLEEAITILKNVSVNVVLAVNWWRWENFQENNNNSHKIVSWLFPPAVNEVKHHFKGKMEVAAKAV